MIPTEPLEAFRFAGPAGLALCIIIFSYIISRDPLGRHSSISAHAASSQHQTILLSISLIIGGSLFLSYSLFWLTPYYELPNYVPSSILAAGVALVIISLFPVNKNRGLGHRLHLIAGATVALAMLICLAAIVSASNVSSSSLSYILVVASIVYSILSILLYILAGNKRRNFLIFESIYIFSFTACMLSLSLKL